MKTDFQADYSYCFFRSIPAELTVHCYYIHFAKRLPIHQ